ncbi:DegQ family serine endoprotease [Allofranklinella schreckenbergeri]|uniref:Probable periplasmic serine endoprotease DegP-like n=1 Tax=Allofranklinella schreckenbergeri TaxID=1076744 RepID=A0A3M6QHT8_9BURK|nr:DegQ family serine endoprotease [Allofranklinella schreckenbergeri]RMW98576.1 DegQ family serine endoprotease [Allofranklinella schreckenbergeri]RMX02664.1 DegQ family serine endoprotease [Allofranklinella schreckenbergeri]RMX10569.1 DegQ family serine endoprotease [Allofranklinella schreckenbergeri]RRD41571.1 PDZ domain-containing protein [Comamonadaceae bacterium OH3737_COT-264]
MTSASIKGSLKTAALGLVAGAALVATAGYAQQAPVVVGPVAGPVAGSVASAAAQLPDFTRLVEAVGPSVVNIRTTARMPSRQWRGSMDEEMLELFRQFGFPVPGLPQPRRGGPDAPSRVVPSGVGSGFIISADGYILTNHHVVEDSEDVLVTLTDQREFKAKVIGSDERTDVALIKIEAENLPVVRIGNVNQLKVGQWVMAIGSPFGLENTVTAGIVSAKQRDTGSYLPFIQTDVAVNPGNSGGPLLNMQGEVVGINSQIYSRSGGFMGISFAIPIDEAIKVSDQLRSGGRVVRGRIGVRIGPVNPDVAESLGLERRNNGALVAAVEPDSPAAKAGVQAGDIITHFNGKALESVSDLPRLVGDTAPGTASALRVFRHGKSVDLPITIGEVAEAAQPRSQGDEKQGSAKAEAFGLSVQSLGEAQKKELGVRGGVRVTAVQGAAAQAGLQAGDVILAVGQTEVLDHQAFSEAMQKANPKRPLSVLVRRDDWAQYVLIRPQD